MVNNSVFVAVLLIFKANGDRVGGKEDGKGASLGRRVPSRQSLKYLFRRGTVSRGPEDGVYSPTRRRKKNASVTRSATVRRRGEGLWRKVVAIQRTVVAGRACWARGGGSAALYCR